MAKGMLHLNVEFSAVADEEGKFGRLAKLLGLADADHARGRCEHLWVACTRRGEADLPQWLVEQLLGESGPEALVEAELAVWSAGRGDSKTRRLRIGGAAKHCMWMSSSNSQMKREQRAKGGESRAKTSSRQLDGRFAPAGESQLDVSPAPSSSSEISSASEILPEEDSLPRAIPPSTERVPQYVHPKAPEVGGGAADLDQRKAARAMIWRELGDLRTRLCADLRVTARPLPAIGDPGERALSDRLLAAGPDGLDAVIADARHALAVLEAEARRDGSVKWVTGGVFEDRVWRRLVAMTLDDAKRARPPPRSDRDANQQPPSTPRKTVILG